ncbi:hypothetical protein [Maridesulfovibrio sp.]|uniref:hypothetical protein n=1 Tax=Maridesulfovibrio sp. TaxID=2795000 RepID=UPI0039EECE3C
MFTEVKISLKFLAGYFLRKIFASQGRKMQRECFFAWLAKKSCRNGVLQQCKYQFYRFFEDKFRSWERKLMHRQENRH